MANLTSVGARLALSAYFIMQLLKFSDAENHDDSPQDVILQEHFYCHSETKRKECSDSAGEAAVLQAVLEQASLSGTTAFPSRPLRRVRGSRWLRDHFPEQTQSITPTECDSFVMETAQH